MFYNPTSKKKFDPLDGGLRVNDIKTINTSLQNSSDIFVYGENIQTHTIHKSNCTLIKEPCNGITKANEKITKNKLNIQKLSCASNGMDVLDDFYTDHSFVNYMIQVNTGR